MMDQEGLYVEIWHTEADGGGHREIHKASRLRVTRIEADGEASVAYLAWDGLD